MPIEQHYRVRFIDYVRKIIGDPDGLLFTEDEIKSAADKWTETNTTTHTVTAYNSRYRLNACATGTPVYELTVSTGVDGAVYILDEAAGVIHFDPADPDNTAVAPVDGSTIGVTFYRINTPKLISELFMILSSNHAKLRLYHDIMGVKMDLKQLSDSFYDQAVRWEIEVCTF